MTFIGLHLLNCRFGMNLGNGIIIVFVTKPNNKYTIAIH
jgi:hypothetical protein